MIIIASRQILMLVGWAVAATSAFESPDVFPISRRQALLQKSKELNPSRSTYTTAGWSNRAATVLTPVAEGVYTADRPFYWNKVDVGCRMTVIELPTSSKDNKPDLWVHSPVGLDGPLKQAIANLGTVKYVVSPNFEHLKFAAEWHFNYPDAEMWGCPGLAERMTNIQWKGEIPFQYRPVGWKGASSSSDSSMIPWDTDYIQAIHVDMEHNPFTGKAFFNEVIYYHKPSKTLITTDFFWNYPANEIPNSEFAHDDTWELAPLAEVPLTSRLWKLGMDKVYAPFFNNFMVTNPKDYQQVCEFVLDEWASENVIPAHGDILRGRDFVIDVLSKFFQLKRK